MPLAGRHLAIPKMLWGVGAVAPVPRLRSSLLSIGWFSWWAQAILSTVSGVLLLFANSVTTKATAFTVVGRVLSLAGLAIAVASLLWTVSYARLAASCGSVSPPTPKQAGERAARIASIGTALNTCGMVVSLFGAEAIVGTLAAQALTQSTTNFGAGAVVANPVQALDLLIVQANTNTIFAHAISLFANMRAAGAASACAAAAEE